MEKVVSYYYDVLTESELPIARTIVTRYSFIKEFFSETEMAVPTYMPEFRKETISLLQRHPEVKYKTFELFHKILLQEETLEYLFSLDDIYTGLGIIYKGVDEKKISLFANPAGCQEVN